MYVWFIKFLFQQKNHEKLVRGKWNFFDINIRKIEQGGKSQNFQMQNATACKQFTNKDDNRKMFQKLSRATYFNDKH